MSMNVEIKKQWVAALESGDYGQCRGHLHSGSSYCCLGVLTELYIQAHPEGHGWRTDSTHSAFFFGSPDDRLTSLLPKAVQEWAGLESASPDLDGDLLIDLNDTEALSFKEIAQEIKGSDL